MNCIYRILIIIFILCGISQNLFSNTQAALPAKFQKVLNLYKNNPQKYRAARFLTDNIGSHKSQSYYWINAGKQKVPFNEMSYPSYEDAVAAFNKLSLASKLTPVSYTTSDASLITG